MNLLLNPVFQVVKSDFCSLVDCRFRGDTIEIMTSIPTLTNSYVSVFVSYKDGKYSISDGGWIDENMYESQEFDDSDVIKRICDQYKDHFQVKEVKSPKGVTFYYKNVNDLKLVSAAVHDMGHFVSSIVNTQNIIYREVEDESKKLFHNRLNGFLRQRFQQNKLEFNHSVQVTENQKIKFNAIVHANARDHYYLMYVSGSRPNIFIKDLSEATVNYEIINDLAIKREYYKKVAIINMTSPGYDRERSGIYIEKLTKALGHSPILYRKEDDAYKLAEAIPVE